MPIFVPAGTVALSSDLQSSNTLFPIFLTPSGIVTLSIDIVRNASSPILSIPFGITKSPLRLRLLSKALLPMVFRFDGNSNDSPVSCCPEKALFPMCSTFTPFIVAGIFMSLGASGDELYPVIVLVLSLNMK